MFYRRLLRTEDTVRLLGLIFVRCFPLQPRVPLQMLSHFPKSWVDGDHGFHCIPQILGFTKQEQNVSRFIKYVLGVVLGVCKYK